MSIIVKSQNNHKYYVFCLKTQKLFDTKYSNIRDIYIHENYLTVVIDDDYYFKKIINNNIIETLHNDINIFIFSQDCDTFLFEIIDDMLILIKQNTSVCEIILIDLISKIEKLVYKFKCQNIKALIKDYKIFFNETKTLDQYSTEKNYVQIFDLVTLQVIGSLEIPKYNYSIFTHGYLIEIFGFSYIIRNTNFTIVKKFENSHHIDTVKFIDFELNYMYFSNVRNRKFAKLNFITNTVEEICDYEISYYFDKSANEMLNLFNDTK